MKFMHQFQIVIYRVRKLEFKAPRLKHYLTQRSKYCESKINQVEII